MPFLVRHTAIEPQKSFVQAGACVARVRSAWRRSMAWRLGHGGWEACGLSGSRVRRVAKAQLAGIVVHDAAGEAYSFLPYPAFPDRRCRRLPGGRLADSGMLNHLL